MSDQVYSNSPKGSAWLVYHRLWKGGGCTTNWAFVFNYSVGLTAYEAWQRARLAGGPAFYEVVTTQLASFPLSALDTKPLSVNTRAALETHIRKVKS